MPRLPPILCPCRTIGPTESWRTDAPERHGFDPALPAAIAARIPQLPFLDGLLIIRHGTIVHESYYNGYDAATLHDIASVTKSWVSALVGMAGPRICYPTSTRRCQSSCPNTLLRMNMLDKRTITLRHLLQMRSGLAFDEDVLNTGG